MTRTDEFQDEMRVKLLKAAAKLLAEHGVLGTTVRAVAQAAGVQPPAIYRTFGDKDAMLEAVAEAVFAGYVDQKTIATNDGDAIQQLRDGFDRHVAFGLAHPAVFILVSSATGDRKSRVQQEGLAVLAEKIRLVARSGRLKVAEETAVALMSAMSVGSVLMLLNQAEDRRAHLAIVSREAVMAAIVDDMEPKILAPSPATLASTLSAHLDDYDGLTGGERHLLMELLTRISGGGAAQALIQSRHAR